MEIPLEGALLKRSSAEKYCFEIHSPQLMAASKKNKEGRLYFKADSEAEFNGWFSDLRSVCGRTEVDRLRRSQPLSFVPTGDRARLLSKTNLRGETPLHAAASYGLKARTDLDPRLDLDPRRVQPERPVQTLVWLVENGCAVQAADLEGNTALHLLVAAVNHSNDAVSSASEAESTSSFSSVSLAPVKALLKKGAELTLKNTDSKSALDMCTTEQVAELFTRNEHATEHWPLKPPPPMKTHNCCYVSFLLRESRIAGPESVPKPYLTATLYKLNMDTKDGRSAVAVVAADDKHGSSLHDVVEDPQSAIEPCLARNNYMWWGSSVHFETPLENIAVASFDKISYINNSSSGSSGASASSSSTASSSNTVVLFELRDASKVPPSKSLSQAGTTSSSSGHSADPADGLVAWCVLDVGKAVVNSKDGLQLEMYKYPVDLAQRRSKMTQAEVLLSVDLLVTRAEAP